MSSERFDVVVVGGGAAGLTAALGLARSGFAVVVLEAAASVGASGGLGDVCFAESLLEPEGLAWERRLVERGSFAGDGRRLVGAIYRDPEAFRHCYTILRSRFDPRLAELGERHGVALWTDTLVESLIRDGRRIVGVATSHGPVYADLVFLTEGDAGHLISREGLDRSRDAPAFLFSLQQVYDLPAGEIEKRFRVEAEQGVAYDFLLRYPARQQINARGFLQTNRNGLMLSVALPAAHLRNHAHGQPREILNWFAEMPALRPWLDGARPTAWSARLLRLGGLRDVPYLVEDGLAVGGAAAGLGVAFPSLNVMGPALTTAQVFVRAATAIRAEGGAFDRAALVRHYVEPLQQTRTWRDVEFAQRWPTYWRKTRFLFHDGLDLLLDSAAIWARKGRGLPRKLLGWLSVLARVSWLRWDELRAEIVHFGRALHFREVTPRPAFTRLLLDGALNVFRDLVRRPRPHLPPHGKLRLYFHSSDEESRASAVPGLLRRWFERFRPVLASAARLLYADEDKPLSVRLTATSELLARQVNLLDLLAALGLAFGMLLTSTLLAACRSLFRRPRQRIHDVGSANVCPARSDGEERAPAIGSITPRIRVTWKTTLPSEQFLAVRDLPSICPAGVFEVQLTPAEIVQVQVQAERCIACEACWRLNSFVDWGREGAMLLPSTGAQVGSARNQSEWRLSFDDFERKLVEFDRSLAHDPALIDRSRADHLGMLARYAEQGALHIRQLVRANPDLSDAAPWADELAARAEQRTRHAWDGRFAWASADGRLLRQHHLPALRRLLGVQGFAQMPIDDDSAVLRTDAQRAALALRCEDSWSKHLLADIAARRYLLETVERNRESDGDTMRAGLLASLCAEVRANLHQDEAELSASEQNRADASRTGRPGSAYAISFAQFADPERLAALVEVPGDWDAFAQRGALVAERQEILDVQARLIDLAADRRKVASHREEVSIGLTRQAAHVLAGKLLLWRTFERLERGLDAELAIVLLRVWLDEAANVFDEFTIAWREASQSAPREEERPLVEPDSAPPLRTKAEWLAIASAYASGDFLLRPVDLLRPRLVPEMLDDPNSVPPCGGGLGWGGDSLGDSIPPPQPSPTGGDGEEYSPSQGEREKTPPELAHNASYLAQTLTAENIGSDLRESARTLFLENACTRLLLAELCQSGSALRERCEILRALTDTVIPREIDGSTAGRHVRRDVLELEARKGDCRQLLSAAWQTFGRSLSGNADVQASCFALAEAVAWIHAADCTLGRMAWLSRRDQTEDRDEHAEPREQGRRALAHCLAKIRDRLFRFEEDLAALRRGYYAPHVRATALLRDRAATSARSDHDNRENH